MEDTLFGVREIGLQAATMCADAYDDAVMRFANSTRKDHMARSWLALEMQTARRDLDDAVRINRSRFKLIEGDKHE